jgi:hypothetical protein
MTSIAPPNRLTRTVAGRSPGPPDLRYRVDLSHADGWIGQLPATARVPPVASRRRPTVASRVLGGEPGVGHHRASISIEGLPILRTCFREPPCPWWTITGESIGIHRSTSDGIPGGTSAPSSSRASPRSGPENFRPFSVSKGSGWGITTFTGCRRASPSSGSPDAPTLIGAPSPRTRPAGGPSQLSWPRGGWPSSLRDPIALSSGWSWRRARHRPEPPGQTTS